jgi:hypothetical protein
MVFTGISLMAQEWLGDSTVKDGLLIVFQSIFLAINLSYTLFGIRDKMESRLKWMTLTLGILAIIYYINPLVKEITVSLVTVMITIYYLILFLGRKMNGDNAVGDDDTVNYSYFQVVGN